jgi:hypothetical protein
MSKKGESDTEYPPLLDTTQLPVTHNHMIGAVQGVSLDNIRGTVALLRRLASETDGHKLHLSEDETLGLECLLENTVAALRFEQYYRQD